MELNNSDVLTLPLQLLLLILFLISGKSTFEIIKQNDENQQTATGNKFATRMTMSIILIIVSKRQKYIKCLHSDVESYIYMGHWIKQVWFQILHLTLWFYLISHIVYIWQHCILQTTKYFINGLIDFIRTSGTAQLKTTF